MTFPALPIAPQIPPDVLLEGLKCLYPDVDWSGLDVWELDSDGKQKKRLTTVGIFASGTMKVPEQTEAPLAFDDEIDRAIQSSGLEDDED